MSGGELLLRLWLPGYHTPSLNRTKGHHWSRYRKLKQHAAGVLLEAMREGSGLSAPLFRFATGKLSQIAIGGKAVKLSSPLLPFSTSSLIHLTYTRVTCQPLDAENFAGSTKALTDCLVSAFPGWLPDDSPEHVRIEHVQTQCAARCEQGTWVEMGNASGQVAASETHQ